MLTKIWVKIRGCWLLHALQLGQRRKLESRVEKSKENGRVREAKQSNREAKQSKATQSKANSRAKQIAEQSK